MAHRLFIAVRGLCLGILLSLGLMAFPNPVSAQAASTATWPNRPLRWIIPFPPGGPADINARIIAPRLSERLGQPVVIDNRPGASSNIGYEAAVRAPNDGYTLLLAPAGLVTNPHVFKLNFNPVIDLDPVGQLVTIQVVLVAHPGFAANNLTEAMELARRKPGSVKCAWGGSILMQLACETIRIDGKSDVLVVGYKGSAPALNDLLGGHVDMLFDVPNSAAPHVNGGKLKALATANPTRGQAPFPQAPSTNESIPGFEMTTWQGLFVPVGTPRPVVDRLNRELNAVLAEPEVVRRITESGLQVVPTTPEDFRKTVVRDYERYGQLIRAAGIKATD